MKRTLTTTAALAALAWLISSTTASAQDAAVTAEIEELERMVDGSYWLGESTVVILRQASQQRMSAELEAFADRLAAMAADASLPEHVRTNARQHDPQVRRHHLGCRRIRIVSGMGSPPGMRAREPHVP